MATVNITGASAHATLTTTAADSVVFAGMFEWVEVLNRGSAEMFVRLDGVVAVADAAGTYVVPGWSGLILKSPGSNATLSVVGDGNEYSVSGFVGKPTRHYGPLPAA